MPSKNKFESLVAVAVSPNTEGITPFAEIPVSKIYPNPDQPRKHFDEIDLKELATSIAMNGLIQPIAVVKRGEKYMVVSGERRYRAYSDFLPDRSIRCHIVHGATDKAIAEMALVENIQRENLHPVEEAIYILQLKERFGYTGKSLANILGKTDAYISKAISAAKLSPSVLEEARKQDKVGIELLQELAKVKDEEKQLSLLSDKSTTRETIREQVRTQ